MELDLVDGQNYFGGSSSFCAKFRRFQSVYALSVLSNRTSMEVATVSMDNRRVTMSYVCVSTLMIHVIVHSLQLESRDCNDGSIQNRHLPSEVWCFSFPLAHKPLKRRRDNAQLTEKASKAKKKRKGSALPTVDAFG